MPAKDRVKNDKLLLVVSGDYSEYLKFRNTSPRRMQFVTDEHRLYGMSGTDIILIGSWYNREDKPAIKAIIKQQRLNEVTKP